VLLVAASGFIAAPGVIVFVPSMLVKVPAPAWLPAELLDFG
jgi:hypothetical protein